MNDSEQRFDRLLKAMTEGEPHKAKKKLQDREAAQVPHDKRQS